VNGATVYGEDTPELDPEWFERDDRVACIVTPASPGSEGELSNIVTIGNTPPVLLSAYMTPEQPTERELLYAYGEAEDADRADQEKLFMHYKWMVNGEEVGYDDYVLGPSWWNEGDNVSVYVSVGDGFDRSPAQLIGPVTIQNSLPGAPEIEIVAAGDGGLVCEIVEDAEDLDVADTLTYTTRWREFGNLTGGDDAKLDASFVRPGAEYNCEVWASDEEGAGEIGSASYLMQGDLLRYRWAFDDAGSLAGTDVEAIGDMDGDGLPDLLVSTPGLSGQKVEMGGAVVLGSSGLDSTADLGQEMLQARILGTQAHVFLGTGMSTTPDFDGDGFQDILLSSPEYTVFSEGVGLAVAVGSTRFLADESYTFDPEGEIHSAVGITWGGEPGEGVGRAVVGIDLNQDGLGDMVVASHPDDLQSEGVLRVFSGEHLAAGGPMYMEHTIAVIRGIPGHFGRELERMPDADWDGVEELLISAPSLNNNNGAVLVLRSGDIETYESMEDLTETTANQRAIRIDGAGAERLGEALEGGVWQDEPALLMGSSTASDGQGLAYLTDPIASRSLSDAVLLLGNDESGFGASLAFVGDTDRDGSDEIAIGATGESAVFDGAGAVYFFALDDLVAGSVYETTDAVRVIHGEDKGEKTGTSIYAPGDMTGDGMDDLIIGATGMDAPEGWNEGGLFLWVQP